MTQIHPSAIVDSQAELAEDVVVGPFCLVGPKVCIGAGTVLRSHVVVEGSTTIGARNVIYAGASIGCHPQDKKYRGEDTRLVVGDDNVIRENCTMSIGTIQDQGLTTVGSRNLFMANAHVAHDCQVGSDVILANNVALGGHVIVGDHAILGGQSAAHQFVRIGAYAMVGGAAGVLQDVPPFVMAHLNPAKAAGLNLVGLRRAGASRETISAFKQAFRLIWRSEMPRSEALDLLANDYANLPQVMEFVDFVRSSERGLCPAEKNVEKKLDDDAV